jgi:hypothetical protein
MSIFVSYTKILKLCSEPFVKPGEDARQGVMNKGFFLDTPVKLRN